jgi:hypothetical protein
MHALQILALVAIVVVGLVIYRLISVRKKMKGDGLFRRIRRRPNHVAEEGTTAGMHANSLS